MSDEPMKIIQNFHYCYAELKSLHNSMFCLILSIPDVYSVKPFNMVFESSNMLLSFYYRCFRSTVTAELHVSTKLL